MGRWLDRPVQFVGQERPTALLNDGRAAYESLGHPAVSADQMIYWTTEWIARGGPTLGKPTHFQTHTGQF